MAQKQPLSTKNFKQKLAAFLVSAKTQRDNAQDFLLFGLEQFRDHGNTGFLTLFLNGCVGVKSLPTRTLKDFIIAHANVKYAKRKDDTYGFKKDGKGEPKVTIPDYKWYDWEGAKHNDVKPMDVMGQAKALLARIEKNLKDGKVKDKAQAEKVRDDLKLLTA